MGAKSDNNVKRHEPLDHNEREEPRLEYCECDCSENTQENYVFAKDTAQYWEGNDEPWMGDAAMRSGSGCISSGMKTVQHERSNSAGPILEKENEREEEEEDVKGR